MFVLSITNLPSPGGLNLPFFRCEPNCRWIYVLSNNFPLINNYLQKLNIFTPDYLKPYLRFEILNIDTLTEEEIDNNLDPEREIEIDKFYLQGTVNADRSNKLDYDDFTIDKWIGELTLPNQFLYRSI